MSKSAHSAQSLASLPSYAPGEMHISLLTGGGDRPYAIGLASALAESGVSLDFIASDHLIAPELLNDPLINFLNLRGNMSAKASIVQKCCRILVYYGKLIRYALKAKPQIFHILWNGKLELLDRILMIYYKVLGKRLLFTAHNVNAGKRDGNDTLYNRLSLKFQYFIVDHIFVHTEKMKTEMMEDFSIAPEKISIIPFCINFSSPRSGIRSDEAKRRFGIASNERVLLFFGHIAPYKGLEYLIEALSMLQKESDCYRLIIAGKIKDCMEYWGRIEKAIAGFTLRKQIILRSDYIPDEEVELFFQAADALILPYAHIYQSGVLFLSYSFGLPAIAADVGSLSENIVEGETGFLCRPKDPVSLASAIHAYFESGLYRDLESRRSRIRQYASEHHSWTKAAEITQSIYRNIL